MTRRDGSKFWADCLAGKVSLPEEAGFTLVFLDISEKKEEEDELLLSAKVFEFSGEGVMITDTKDAILKVNDAFVRMTGYSVAEVVGQQPDFLNSGRQDSLFYENMWAVVHHQGHWTGEVWNRLKNGGILSMWMAVTAVKNALGELDH